MPDTLRRESYELEEQSDGRLRLGSRGFWTPAFAIPREIQEPRLGGGAEDHGIRGNLGWWIEKFPLERRPEHPAEETEPIIARAAAVREQCAEWARGMRGYLGDQIRRNLGTRIPMLGEAPGENWLVVSYRSASLLQLPWELLEELSIAFYPHDTSRAPAPAQAMPEEILWVTARKALDRIGEDEISKEVPDWRLRRIGSREGLHEALKDGAWRNAAAITHLDGHGHGGEKGYNTFNWEKTNDTAKDLRGLLGRWTPVVVAHTCQGLSPVPGPYVVSSLGKEILEDARGPEVFLGFQHKCFTPVAQTLARSFYDELKKNQDVWAAIRTARAAIFQSSAGGPPFWASLRVYTTHRQLGPVFRGVEPRRASGGSAAEPESDAARGPSSAPATAAGEGRVTGAPRNAGPVEPRLRDLLLSMFLHYEFLPVTRQFDPGLEFDLPPWGHTAPAHWWFEAVNQLKARGLLQHRPFWDVLIQAAPALRRRELEAMREEVLG